MFNQLLSIRFDDSQCHLSWYRYFFYSGQLIKFFDIFYYLFLSRPFLRIFIHTFSQAQRHGPFCFWQDPCGSWQAMAIRPGRSSSLRFSRCSLPAALISSGSVSSFCLDCSRSCRCFMFLWASARKCWPSRYGGTRRHDDGDFGCTRYISVSE